MFYNIYFIFSFIFIIFLQNIVLIFCNNHSLSEIIPPDPTEIDPIWEAAIRNVVFNTTTFNTSNVNVFIKKNDDEDDDDGDGDGEENDKGLSNISGGDVVVEVQDKSENVPISVMLQNESEISSEDEALHDERKRQREEALRKWVETSLVDVSYKLKIPKSQKSQTFSHWQRLSELLTTEISSLARAITPTITESLYNANVSADCSRDFLRLVFGLQNNQNWAWRMLDANGRFPSGLISGSSFAFGDYDQCLTLDSFSSNSVRSRYCLLHFLIPVQKPESRIHYKDLPNELFHSLEQNQESGFDSSMKSYIKRLYQAMFSTTILNGICVPETCSGEDVQSFIYSLDAFKNKDTEYASEIRVSDCSKVSDSKSKTFQERLKEFLNSLSIHEKVSFFIISILFILPLMVWLSNQIFFWANSSQEKFLEHFSPVKNFKRLTSITEWQKKSKTQFLNILRVSSTLWILVTHCAILGSFFAPSIVYRFEEEARIFAFSWIGQLFYNAFASVEVFFFLSGFLLYRSISNRTKIPTFSDYVFYRFIRLIPAVIGLLSLFFFWHYFGSGPVFELYSKKLINSCRKNWWKTLLMMNNYDKSDDICLVHTWFLSADFQLHILAYPILVAVKKGKFTFARFMFIILISFGLFWSIVKLNSRKIPVSLNALFQIVPEEFYLDMQDLYYPTQNHFISYFVGISTAHYLENKQKNAFKSNLLLIGTFFGFLSIFFPVYWSRENGPIDVQTNIGYFYFIFTKFIHPISISCLCLWSIPRTHKLSSSFVTILSRLSFSIYLTHLPIIWHFLFTTRQPIRLEIYSILFFSGGILLFTLPLALCFHLFIEAPYSNIFQEIFTRTHKNNINNNYLHHQSNHQKNAQQHQHQKDINPCWNTMKNNIELDLQNSGLEANDNSTRL